ncbi:MAG TPA: hypothetical protein PLP88_02220 [Bacteroidales bacterium]|nr:hypothetical protein [Bacteroidales bacterium]
MKTKHTFSTTLFGIAALLAAFQFTSCKSHKENTAADTLENAIEQASGEDADVNMNEGNTEITMNNATVKYDGDIKSWPAAIPAQIPKFEYCKIEGATITSADGFTTYNLKLKGLTPEQIKSYDKDLKSKGFESNLVLVGDKGGTVTATKGDISIALMGGDSNGSLSVRFPE